MKKMNLDKGLMVQLILVLILVIVLLLSLFFKFLLPVAEILAGAALIVMGYNNYRIYKRKAMTAIYIAFGIIVFMGVIWGFISG